MIVIFILTKFGFFSMCKSHYWECVEVKHNQWTCLTNSKPRDANDKALQITSLFDLRGTTNTLTKNYPKYTPPNRSCTKTMDQITAQLGKARVLLQSQVTWLKEGGYFNNIFFGWVIGKYWSTRGGSAWERWNDPFCLPAADEVGGVAVFNVEQASPPKLWSKFN